MTLSHSKTSYILETKDRQGHWHPQGAFCTRQNAEANLAERINVFCDSGLFIEAKITQTVATTTTVDTVLKHTQL